MQNVARKYKYRRLQTLFHKVLGVEGMRKAIKRVDPGAVVEVIDRVGGKSRDSDPTDTPNPSSPDVTLAMVSHRIHTAKQFAGATNALIRRCCTAACRHLAA